MEAVFVLRQIVAGLAHIAKVAVEAEPADQDQVVVSPHAFDWLRDLYGPHAVVDRPINQQFITEALEGARYALAHVQGRDRASRVTLPMIGDSPADTCDGDVKLAAAYAVAGALGGQMEPAPYLGADGAVFPAQPAVFPAQPADEVWAPAGALSSVRRHELAPPALDSRAPFPLWVRDEDGGPYEPSDPATLGPPASWGDWRPGGGGRNPWSTSPIRGTAEPSGQRRTQPSPPRDVCWRRVLREDYRRRWSGSTTAAAPTRP